MTQALTKTLDLDDTAQRLLESRWHITAEAERVHVGVNKATWRVSDYWLACDFPRQAGQVRRMQTLLATLASTSGFDLEVPRLVPTARHADVVRAHGRVWWLTEHVSGRQPDPARLHDTTAVAAGLARLHQLLRSMPPELAVSKDNSVSLFEAAIRLIAERRLGFTAADEKTINEAATLVREQLPQLLAPGMQLIHGDPSNPNLRVRDNPIHLTGALDWDHARVDLALADVATVAQTVVFRSGTATPLKALDTMLSVYLTNGGVPMTLNDVIVGLVLAKFESIAHHGMRFLHREVDHGIVSSQVDKIRAALSLHGAL